MCPVNIWIIKKSTLNAETLKNTHKWLQANTPARGQTITINSPVCASMTVVCAFVNLATDSLREGTDIRRARLYKVQLIFVAYGNVMDEGIPTSALEKNSEDRR